MDEMWARLMLSKMPLLVMDHETTLDDRGRLTIHPRFRRLLGRRVVQVMTPRGLLVRPRATRIRHAERLPPAIEATGEDQALRESQ